MSASFDERPRPLGEPAEDLPFESAVTRLEEIVRRLEEGGLPLEESLKQYESGIKLLRRCYDQLRQAEQRVFALAGEDSDGRPIMTAFDHPGGGHEIDRPPVPRRPRRTNAAEE